LKTALLDNAPTEFLPTLQTIGDLVDDGDYDRRWYREEIRRVASFRYTAEFSGMFGAKRVPLYYNIFQDIAGYSYVFLQATHGPTQQTAENMAAALENIVNH